MVNVTMRACWALLECKEYVVESEYIHIPCIKRIIYVLPAKYPFIWNCMNKCPWISWEGHDVGNIVETGCSDVLRV